MAQETVSIQDRIKREVTEEMRRDGRVREAEIQVEVEDGTVLLTGRVPTNLARRAAAADAWSIPGVNQVDNRLIVEHPESVSLPSDSEIQMSAESTIRWNPDIEISDIQISVQDGWVTLEGSVDAFWKKVQAEELVLHLAGVFGVNNQLTVVPTEDITDQAIAENIIRAINRHPLVDADTVTVSVENRIVTLSGTVPSWAARKAAYDAALYNVGIREVRNDLIVHRP